MRQTQLVAYKFNTICKDIERESVFYFQFEGFKAFQLFTFQWHYIPILWT